MSLKDKLDITWVTVAVCLLLISAFLVVNSMDGWGWFLFVGAVAYPDKVNIEFKE